MRVAERPEIDDLVNPAARRTRSGRRARSRAAAGPWPHPHAPPPPPPPRARRLALVLFLLVAVHVRGDVLRQLRVADAARARAARVWVFVAIRCLRCGRVPRRALRRLVARVVRHKAYIKEIA
jgi:hypothetical protein